MRPVAEPVLAPGLDGVLDTRSALAVEQARDVRSALIAAAQITEQPPELGIDWLVRSIGLLSIHTATVARRRLLHIRWAVQIFPGSNR
jgi:hypothetical protein